MSEIIAKLETVIRERRSADPASSYVAALLAKGPKKIAQKLGEEATETVIAALTEDAAALTGEAADLIFHLLIMLDQRGLRFADILTELERRDGLSGIDEKKSRGKPAG